MEDGIAVANIEFVAGSDPDEKYSDVVEKINTMRSELPDDILNLSTMKWTVSDVNILQIALVSDSASYVLLEQEAETLKRELEKVNGVLRVKTWAYPEQEVRVALRLEKLAQLRIPLNQVMAAIQSANMDIPGGYIDIGSKRFSIQTSGDYQSLEDIRNTIIHSSGTKTMYLKDVADVLFDYEDNDYYARFNGQRAVFVTINQKQGTNIFHVMDNVKKTITAFQENLSPAIDVHFVFDQSVSVQSRIHNFVSNLLQGVVLVGLVIFMSLSFRASIIVMIAIPVSILIGIGFVDLSGYGLEQMSIAGLVIVLGILVDNAIVVTANVSRFLKMGYSHQDAAINGTNQIGWAIVSATATTVLAFVPMMMIGDVTGDFIRSMPVTVVYTLSVSLLVALTLTPYLSSKFLIVEKVSKQNKFQQWLNYLIESPYRKTLDYALSHRKIVISIALFTFIASLTLFFLLVSSSFFPKAEKPQFIINIDTPKGTSLDKTNEVAMRVESYLAQRGEIQHYAANIGRGNPRIYYNIREKRERSTYAQFVIQLKKYDAKMMEQLIHDLRQQFNSFPNAQIEIKELVQGPYVEAPIATKIMGDNLGVLKTIAWDVERMISSTAGTINIVNPVRTSKTDLHVNINREKAGLLGVPLVEIDRTVRASISGMPVSVFRDQEGKDYDIVVRLPIQNKPQITDFDRIYVSSVSGAQIPLKQLASIEFKTSPLLIAHHDLERSITLTADVLPGYFVDKVTQQIISKLEAYNLPKGYRYYIGGELESRQESFGGMFKAIIIAVVGIFGVLVLQFRSFSQPLIVFSALPLAIIGSIFALLITGNTFSFTAFIGLTSLVGIVVNNSIILVDYTNQLRQEGKDIITALKEAGETRFQPIVLTTATTIGGLLPLTLRGGTLWAPMGWTIIGGLLTSTILTLVVVPVLYKVFTPNSNH